MRIGVLADRTGASVPTIRYYEEIGLLRRPARRNGQRDYDHEDVRRVAFIRRCRDFNFSIEQIRALLSLLRSEACCTEARLAAENHLAEIRNRIAALSALEKSIAGLVNACATTCDGGAASDCVILRP
jgi:MerR family transcriptional regulator, copper efflux regulator